MRIAHWLLALAVTGSASAPARDPQTVGHDAKQQFRAAIARWTEAAAGMGILLVLTMSVLGGCWWRSEIVPGWLRRVGYAFPTSWTMRGLHELISWGGGVRDILLPCAILALFGLAAGFAAQRLLRRSP